MNKKENTYENRIALGRNRHRATAKQTIAGAGLNEGTLKAGISINNSVLGRRKIMASAMKN